MPLSPSASVAAVHLGGTHSFSKDSKPTIELVAGLGVAGDAHEGATVRHRSRVAADPTQPNLRQVHLIHSELFDEVAGSGFDVAPGQLGENITTDGIDLLGLPVGTVLKIGPEALIGLTGLRNPCKQIENFSPGLLSQVLKRAEDGTVTRLAGVMAVVIFGGTVGPGDGIEVALPPGPHRPLVRV